MVSVELYKGSPLEAPVSTIAVVIKGKDVSPILWIDEKLGGILHQAIEKGDFKGEAGESILFYPQATRFDRYVVASTGDEGLEGVRLAVASIINKVKSVSRDLVIHIPGTLGVDMGDAVEQAACIISLTLYDPGRTYKAKTREKPRLNKVLINPGVDLEDASERIHRGVVIGEAVNYARDIANAPSNIMNPDGVEEEARKLAEKNKLGIKVLHVDDLRREGLNGIVAVGSGGGSPPRLVVLEYRGRNAGGWDIAIVGKTVTFDAGGLDIKTAQAMADMKFDKSGGAAVLGVMKAVSELKLPVNVVGVLPVVENIPGPRAYRPRDVIKMYNGLTVEVKNTDAEGRIILADALSYVEKNYKPKEIIDIATLTGAIVIALGNHAIGLFSNDDDMAEKLIKTGVYTGEKLWRMPLWREYYQQLESEVADLSNVGGRAGGAITAAAFLSKFLEETKKWSHLDIAGTAWVQEAGPKKPYYPKGATGIGVRLITYYIITYHCRR